MRRVAAQKVGEDEADGSECHKGQTPQEPQKHVCQPLSRGWKEMQSLDFSPASGPVCSWDSPWGQLGETIVQSLLMPPQVLLSTSELCPLSPCLGRIPKLASARWSWFQIEASEAHRCRLAMLLTWCSKAHSAHMSTGGGSQTRTPNQAQWWLQWNH
jgi:hypothetical protein